MSDSDIFVVFGVLGGVVGLAATIPYIIDIVRGRTKPERAAFLLFSIAGSVSFAGQVAEGASLSLFFAAALVVSSYTIFLLSLRYGVGGFGRRDKIGLVVAALILAIWWVSNSAALALLLMTAFNTVGKVLIMCKVYDMPHTELLFSWVMSTIASICAVISVGSLDWILILVPLQNGLTVGAIAAIIYIRRRQVPALERIPQPVIA